MSFHTQSFAARYQVMGDEAESWFERIYPNGYVRFGLNRPPLHMPSIPERLRHMPDYLTSKCFVEVKGIGRDDQIKLKVMEFSVMNFWHSIHPLELFIWSSHRWAWAQMDLWGVRALIEAGKCELGTYHDGKSYFAIKAEHFTWTEVERV